MFHKYPWTDYNGQNWNWILEEMKKLSADVEQLRSDFSGFSPEQVAGKLEELGGKVLLLEEKAQNLGEFDQTILESVNRIKTQMRVIEFNNKNLVVNSNFNRLISRTGNTTLYPFDGWALFDETVNYTAYELLNQKYLWRLGEYNAGDKVGFIQHISTPYRAAGLTVKLFDASGTVEALIEDSEISGMQGVVVYIRGSGSFSGIIVAPGDYDDIAPISANYIPKSDKSAFSECSTVMYKTPLHAHFNGYITENTKIVASVPCSAIFADELLVLSESDIGLSKVQVTVCTVNGFSPIASYEAPAAVSVQFKDYEWGAHSVNVEFNFSSSPGTNNTPCSVILRGSSAMFFAPII